MKGFNNKPGLFLCLFWLAVVTSSYAQKQIGDTFFVDPTFSLDHWTVEDGLPVNSVNDIIQTPDGYIWLATFDGLVRFDGVRFKVYKSAEYPGLPSNRIVDLDFTPDGTLWMRMQHEALVTFAKGAFRKLNSDDGLNGEHAYCFYKQENSDDLWICTENGLSVYSDGILEPFYPEIITEVVAHLYIDEHGIIWYKDNQFLNLYRFDGSQKTLMVSSAGITIPSPVLTLNKNRTIFGGYGHIYEYSRGTIKDLVPNLPDDFQVLDFSVINNIFDGEEKKEIIAASLTRGLFKLLGDSLFLINSEYKGNKRSVFRSVNDNLWVVGENHVLFNNWVAFSFNDIINELTNDHEGSLWIGSESAGLFRLKPNLFTIYSEKEGAPGRNIYPVYEATDGSIWFGTHGYGPARLKNGVISQFHIEYPPPGNQFVRSIIETNSGELLISLYGEGLYTFNRRNNTFEITSTPESSSASPRLLSIPSLFEDSRQRLWAGSSLGLFWKKDSDWNKIPDNQSNAAFPVRYITEAPDSSLWMGTDGGGIQHFQNGTFTTYTQGDGLASNLVRSLYIDTVSVPAGYVLWVGTENKGLNRLVLSESGPDFGTITSYTEQTGLYDNVVHQILVDDYDRFWMSGNKGIFWVTRKQLNQFARGETDNIRSTAYTEQDGLRNREANGGIQPAGIKSKDGRIWFPTQNGLVSADPDNIIRNEVPPPVVIEEIESNKELIFPSKEGKIVLNANQRDFEINYTGLSFMVPEKVRFRYRLKDFNEEWIEAGTRRTAFYTNVPPGDYEFEVLAANNEGIWSSEPARVIVEVLPYFYETNVFYLLVILALTGCIFMFVQIRIRNLKKRERVLEQSVKERTKEIEHQKEIIEQNLAEKEILLKEIHHRVKNNLQIIYSMLNLQKDSITDEKVLEAIKTGQGRIKSMSMIHETLYKNDDIKQVEVARYIRNLVEHIENSYKDSDTQVETIYELEKCEVGLDFAIPLGLTVNEVVSNAFKHAFNGSQKGVLKIKSSIKEGFLKLIISDNGPGLKINHDGEHFLDTLGLQLIDDMIRQLNGNKKLATTSGTSYTFNLPLHHG